jgi:outer membrane protein OmpA-like peptidoglycan-associated protein
VIQDTKETIMRFYLTAGVAVLLIACGSTPPPRELVDAQAVYDKVKAGQAAKYKPEQVHEAKVALDTALKAFEDDGVTDKVRDLSYIAQRKAELADSEAGYAAAQAQKDQASKDILGGLKQTQGELSQTKLQLENEKKARAEAEKRAKDAMDKLAAAAFAVKEEPRGTVITLPGSVLFPTGKWELLPGAMEKLNAVADALKNQGDVAMTVEGHTDSQGTVSENNTLSQKRAESVRTYLLSRGLPADHITAVGVGQSRPVADNSKPEGRQNNRRVEIIVKPIEKR